MTTIPGCIFLRKSNVAHRRPRCRKNDLERYPQERSAQKDMSEQHPIVGTFGDILNRIDTPDPASNIVV